MNCLRGAMLLPISTEKMRSASAASATVTCAPYGGTALSGGCGRRGWPHAVQCRGAGSEGECTARVTWPDAPA
eukprot:2100812-Prymnesium_polylepis.1